MPDLDSFLLFAGATLLLNITPGPDMVYVTGRAMSDGIRGGMVASLGIAGGLLMHIAALAAGVATLLAANPFAYTVIRLAGAAYLIWLGVDAFRDVGANGVVRLPQAENPRRIFTLGVLTSALNPKIALFFLALLPQFTDPARGNAAVQLVVLGLWFIASGTVVNLLVVTAVSRGASRWRREDLNAGETRVSLLKRITGVLLIVLGARMALYSG
jgi:threonine/homoserine/homoserine lactone efflux protein